MEENGSVGLTTRDLVIQTKTLVEGVVSDVSEMRTEQAKLRSDVDELKTARAVEMAEEDAKHTHEAWFSTRRGKVWGGVYAVSSLICLTFGPNISHALFH